MAKVREEDEEEMPGCKCGQVNVLYKLYRMCLLFI